MCQRSHVASLHLYLNTEQETWFLLRAQLIMETVSMETAALIVLPLCPRQSAVLLQAGVSLPGHRRGDLRPRQSLAVVCLQRPQRLCLGHPRPP